MSRRAVFLDRDGVINEAVVRDRRPYPPDSLDAVRIIPGVFEALTRLHTAGYFLVVVTNQPDVARGKQTRQEVEAIHHKLQAELPIDSIQVCYHDDADGCTCRKPLPGMLVNEASTKQLDLSASYMVGDRWRDIEAGKQAGCKTLFIDYQYDEEMKSQPDVVVNSLLEAAEWILRRT